MKNIKNGTVGENALWDGPLDISSFPTGKGSSSGNNGMEVLNANCGCGEDMTSIMQRVKR